MSDKGHIFQINISNGGVPKTAIQQGEVTEVGLAGDVQRDKRYHGGPQRALCLYPLELILQLQSEGHPIYPGSTGENLTVSGLDWAAIVPGTRLRVGGARLEISKYATPCRTIAGSFLDGAFTRIGHAQHPGWSRLCARVIEAGIVQPGDSVAVDA